ncbi:MAG: aromatic-ring-hydroxylating dioxygenase [Ilumatobacteraceae bacterium]|nr:aromatic-ring-hydroxylating dioxygenase [Ilumatobacteraceae bacterium]
MDAREGIERLLMAYCWGIDTGDFESTSALFGTEGLYGLVGSGAARGAGQVLANFKASVRTYDGVPRTRHVITNIVIDVDDGGVTGSSRCYVQVMHQPPGEEIRPIVVGTYLDRLHQVDGQWQFAERRMHLELVGNLTSHLQPGFL